MSSNLQLGSVCAPLARRCRMSQRMAKAAVQGMRAPAAMRTMAKRAAVKRVVIERQIVGHIPAEGNDPMEAPDL